MAREGQRGRDEPSSQHQTGSRQQIKHMWPRLIEVKELRDSSAQPCMLEMEERRAGETEWATGTQLVRSRAGVPADFCLNSSSHCPTGWSQREMAVSLQRAALPWGHQVPSPFLMALSQGYITRVPSIIHSHTAVGGTRFNP